MHKLLASALSLCIGLGPVPYIAAEEPAPLPLAQRLTAGRELVKAHFLGATLTRADYSELEKEVQALAAPDAAQGGKLVQEKACETCHHNKTLGDAKAIYLRKDRRVTSMEKLKAQVAACNSELNLQLFPDEEEHIVAFLNDTYYKFGK